MSKTYRSFDLGPHTAHRELPSRAWALLRKLHRDRQQTLDEERRRLETALADADGRIDAVAVDLGILAFEMTRAIARSDDTVELKFLKAGLDRTLRRLDVRIEDPVGQQLEGELLDRCEVLRDVPHPEAAGHLVGETLSPVVWRDGRVIQQATVIGWLAETEEGSENLTTRSEHPGGA